MMTEEGGGGVVVRGNGYDGGMYGGMGDVRDYMYDLDMDRMGARGPIGVCWNYMRGECRYGVDCKFRHA